MKIKVKIQRTKEEKELSLNSKATAKEVLNKLKINPTTVIVTRNREVITENTMLNDKDSLEILSVISGG
ncbi:MAG: MoaD/ThiS family protein [Nanoarchaeota archaeon]